MKVSTLLDQCEREEWRAHRSRDTLQSNLRILRRVCGDDDIAALHYTRLKQIADTMATGRGGKVLAPATVKRRMETLSAALLLATKMTDDQGQPLLVAKPTFPSFEIDNIQDRVIADDEASALFEEIAKLTQEEPDRDWSRFDAMVRFLLATACRRGEALRAHAGHFETRIVQGKPATFVQFMRYSTKSKKPRVVPVTPEIVALLPALKLKAGNGPLFPFHPSQLFRMWRSLRKRMAARGFDFSLVRYHTMRHTTLTKAMKKYPLALVSKLAGHASVQITASRYGHVNADDLVEMVGDIAA
jgi:integrase